jgi:ABC-type lipoprotein release transport system permease subunit
MFITLLMGKKVRGWFLLTSLIAWIALIFGTLIAAISGSVDSSVNEVERIMSPSSHIQIQPSHEEIEPDEFKKLIEQADAENIDL